MCIYIALQNAEKQIGGRKYDWSVTYLKPWTGIFNILGISGIKTISGRFDSKHHLTEVSHQRLPGNSGCSQGPQHVPVLGNRTKRPRRYMAHKYLPLTYRGAKDVTLTALRMLLDVNMLPNRAWKENFHSTEPWQTNATTAVKRLIYRPSWKCKIVPLVQVILLMVQKSVKFTSWAW